MLNAKPIRKLRLNKKTVILLNNSSGNGNADSLTILTIVLPDSCFSCGAPVCTGIPTVD